MSTAVKLRRNDKKVLDALVSKISKVKRDTTKSETLGLCLKFAEANMDRFLETVLEDLEKEPMLDILREPARGSRTNARRVE